jgi:CBS domain-containing protein
MALHRYMKEPVAVIAHTATLREAARLMHDRCVGALVITDASKDAPTGIITDRDIVHMIADGCDPQKVTVDKHVRSALRTVAVSDELEDAVDTMRAYGLRRLPVVDNAGKLVGIIAFDDVVVALGRQIADLAATVSGELAQERDNKQHSESVVAGALAG